MARKLVAIVLVLTLCLAFGSTAFAASRCPNCNGNYGIKSCSSSLGRSDTPNWVSCPITAACLYDIVSYWTGIHCTSCDYSDNAYDTHPHKLEHKKCSPSQYKADMCPY